MPCGAGLALLGRGSMELTGGAVFCASDPHYASVVLLANFNGADGSTTITDSSTYADHKTCSAGESLSNTESKFGGTSLQVLMRNPSGFNCSGTRFARPSGTGYTLEFWYKRVSSVNATAAPILLQLNDGFGGPIITIAQYTNVDSLSFRVSTGAVDVYAFTPGADGWIHVACSIGADDVARFYIEGVLKKSEGVGGSAGTWTLYVTGTGPETPTAQEVYMDALRITQGVDRYPSAFTPPTQAFCYDGWGLEETDPPTTVPPVPNTDPLWSSVRFLSAMDLTKINDKTSVAYTQDSAAVTAIDPFDGVGALSCVYPPESPTSTPFSPVELATLTLRGASGSCVEMWVRLDAWTAWTSGAYKWANLVQQDDLGGDPAWAVGIADELADGVVTPCLQLFSHYIDRRSYLEIWRRTWARAAFPVDGQWHHLAVDFRSYSGFVTTIVVYLDGAAIAALTAPDYTVGQTLQFAGQTTFDIVEGTGIYTTPAGLSSTTFDGALDEVRVTEASRYPSNFTVPHYAFPRS